MPNILVSPPPSNAFWLRENYPVDSEVGVCYVQMEMDPQRRTFKAPSPVDTNRKYQELMVNSCADMMRQLLIGGLGSQCRLCRLRYHA